MKSTIREKGCFSFALLKLQTEKILVKGSNVYDLSRRRLKNIFIFGQKNKSSNDSVDV